MAVTPCQRTCQFLCNLGIEVIQKDHSTSWARTKSGAFLATYIIPNISTDNQSALLQVRVHQWFVTHSLSPQVKSCQDRKTLILDGNAHCGKMSVLLWFTLPEDAATILLIEVTLFCPSCFPEDSNVSAETSFFPSFDSEGSIKSIVVGAVHEGSATPYSLACDYFNHRT